MSLFIVVCALWGIGKAIAAARERARQAQIGRIKREQKRQREEQARLREDFRCEQAEARERAKRQAEIERETIRLAKEQAKQAAQIAKHEAQIAELEFRMTQAETDIAAETERIAGLYALMDIAAAEQAAAVPGSKADVRAQKQIINYQSAIHAAEKRKAKAEYSKQAAAHKLTA